MTTRKKKESASEQEQTKGRVKVGKLTLNKETVKDLTGDEAKRIRGGAEKTATKLTGTKPGADLGG